jgi:hypothetical protein
MTTKTIQQITKEARFFLQPQSAAQRRYEALRAFFVEKRKSAQVATDYGYTAGSFRVLCAKFRKNPTLDFFQTQVTSKPKARRPTKTQARREQIIQLRKQNLSVYDIADAISREGERISPALVSLILREEGFTRLPRRGDEQRMTAIRPMMASAANVEMLDLSERTTRTQFGGLFLFVPDLVALDLPRVLKKAGFPGSKKIPAEHAMRALLALKLFGNKRFHHVMSHTFDEGLALFAGLNVIPKRSFLTEYSCRITPGSYPILMREWFDRIGDLGLPRGESFDLDFHTIPYHGDDALVEKHYVSKRSRRQKGVLAFLAQDDDHRVFCYANSALRKDEQNDEILKFVEFWKKRVGRAPKELVFDSKLTTYANLNRLNKMNISFITLRRRSTKMLEQIRQKPLSAWQRIELENIARAYRTPRILDERMELREYEGSLRQLTITDLGHEEPTILITNQLDRSAAKLIARYASRMIIENGIAEAIDFFHMDALSSAVPLKTDCDLQLTLMANSLYRRLGYRIGNGYQRVRAAKIFRDFIQASATIDIAPKNIEVRFQKRAHNPLLVAANLHKTDVRLPWIGGKRLRLTFG